MNEYAIRELKQYEKGLKDDLKYYPNQSNNAEKRIARMKIKDVQQAISKLQEQSGEVIAEGKMIMPLESEGFLIDGEFIGDIVREKFGDKSIEYVKLIIHKCKESK